MASNNYQVFANAFDAVASNEANQNYWTIDTCWVAMMLRHQPSLKVLDLNVRKLCAAITSRYRHDYEDFSGRANHPGVFRCEWMMRDPITCTRRRVRFYYIAKPGTVVERTTGKGVDLLKAFPQGRKRTRSQFGSCGTLVHPDEISEAKRRNTAREKKKTEILL